MGSILQCWELPLLPFTSMVVECAQYLNGDWAIVKVLELFLICLSLNSLILSPNRLGSDLAGGFSRVPSESLFSFTAILSGWLVAPCAPSCSESSLKVVVDGIVFPFSLTCDYWL